MKICAVVILALAKPAVPVLLPCLGYNAVAVAVAGAVTVAVAVDSKAAHSTAALLVFGKLLPNNAPGAANHYRDVS